MPNILYKHTVSEREHFLCLCWARGSYMFIENYFSERHESCARLVPAVNRSSCVQWRSPPQTFSHRYPIPLLPLLAVRVTS